MCPRSSDPFYIVTCYINWVITSRTQMYLHCGQRLSIHKYSPWVSAYGFVSAQVLEFKGINRFIHVTFFWHVRERLQFRKGSPKVNIYVLLIADGRPGGASSLTFPLWERRGWWCRLLTFWQYEPGCWHPQVRNGDTILTWLLCTLVLIMFTEYKCTLSCVQLCSKLWYVDSDFRDYYIFFLYYIVYKEVQCFDLFHYF